MSATGHLLVRASAGTGKTHELTSRYLALLLTGADADRCLATTFTRKAAHEILDRVLLRLSDAARGGPELEGLRRAAGRAVTAEECSSTLAGLLRGMDRIRIGTIDSYFVQLARLFALDLGLPPSWRIADEGEAERIRSEAVQDVVSGAEKLELLELLFDLQRRSFVAGAHAAFLRSAKHGREALLESTPEAWHKIAPLPDATPEALASAIAELPRLALPKTKAGKERARWAAARAKILGRISAADWRGLLAETLVQRVVAKEAEFDGVAIEDAHVAVLRPIVEHALHVATTLLVLQNRATRAVLERFEASYRALTRESGLLGFEDLPEALAPLAERGPLAAREIDPAFRLDGRIDHLLLDEFQDTAPVQWRVLRPLADGILSDASGERSFFCVGDEKQSIYGWRAAEPRLLRRLADERSSLASSTLRRSWRSSVVVLETATRVFGGLSTNPAVADRDAELVEAAAEFERAYVPLEAARDLPGAAFLLRARLPRDGEGPQVPAFALAVERVLGVLADAPRASVGVLLRRRKGIAELILRLREAGIAASDEGGNPLTDSVAVQHALSLLHLADHPGDTIAAFHVATSPLGARVGLAPGDFRERAESVARAVRTAVAESGLGGFVGSIRPRAEDGYAERDRRRFGQLVDLALSFESRASSRSSAFVDHVRRAKVEDPSAAQVRVMTVHGAKGLEFDAVVLPDLDARVLGREEGLFTLRPDPEGPIEVVTHGLAKAVAVAHPELEAVRADAARRDMTEELCVLYVALTRAVHRLDLIVHGQEKEGSGLTFAAILRGALGVTADGPDGVAWERFDRTRPWFRAELARAASASEARAEPRPLKLAPPGGPRSLAARAPSSAEDLAASRAADLLRPRDSIAARGKLVHRWLQEVEWIETFDRGDEELLAIGRRMESEEKLLATACADFRAMLTKPRTREALSRDRFGAGADVWRERPFALVEPGAQELWTGAFDRVVVARESGRPVSAEVLDYKTDRIAREALHERANSYLAQMAAYRRALARMLSLPESAIRARLLFLHLDEVVEV